MIEFSNALAERMRLVTAPGTSSMRSKANALRAQGIEVVNFAAGELFFDASEGMRRHAVAAVNGRRNRYTPPLGMPELRERLAEHLSLRLGVRYAPDEVAVTCGAKQALFNTALILLNPGDEVLIPAPYWETFPTQIQLAGGVPVIVDTTRSGFRPRVEDLHAALTDRTRMIVLNTPNNPTGVVYDESLLRDIGEFARRHGLWIVFDECYGELVREGHVHHNVVSLCPELKAQTIVVNSFSKSHAVTGWRVGYAAGPRQVIGAMHNLQGHTTSNPSTLSQYAAHGVMEDGDPSFLHTVNTFLEDQARIAREIVGEVRSISVAPAEGAFYLYLRVASRLGGRYGGRPIETIDALAELLLGEAHSAVVPGSAFGDPCGLRISYAVETSALTQGLLKIRDVLNAID
ncbi:pyridoxal phosphate-dependent aminotransferase [Roseateles depolymerans]|uniref:Aminotransferase n=1 Tax=Roseateles depolymerans TaxID=76731 RepID=A0A0U3M9C4_9BURK|nr:pyridoxal phosphate-dependent aminotransferase [Roseateles depolymerans]ALV05181.1 aminotransferase [Roseateles depolymerans]REG14803.1 aspartate aminotransferase [Roseateles depolymerans]